MEEAIQRLRVRRGAVAKYKSYLEGMVNPIFKYFCYGELEEFSSRWKEFYCALFVDLKESARDKVLDVIPYLFSYVLISKYESNGEFYDGLEIASKCCQLMQCVVPTDDVMNKNMIKYIGISLIRKAKETADGDILESIEDTSGLMEFERRPRLKSELFNPRGYSGLESSARAKSMLEFSHPKGFDKEYFNLDDAKSHSLLIRSLNKGIDRDMDQAKVDFALHKASVYNQFLKEKQFVSFKQKVVESASDKDKSKFMSQLRKNQLNGVYSDDPSITISLMKTANVEEKKNRKTIETNVREIVDDVLYNASRNRAEE